MFISQNTVVEVSELNETLNFSRGYGEDIFSAISAGVFLILIGAIFATTHGLFGKILDFFRGFNIVRVSDMEIFLPVPASPEAHSIVYSAVAQFSFVWGLFQIFILAFRFVAGSPPSKKAETASNVVFWSGASYLIRAFLNETTTLKMWFEFWAGVMMIIGVSLIARAIILAVGR